MEHNSYVMSIDIGTTKIAAVVGRMNDKGNVVVEASAVKESQGIRRGMVENVEETVRSIHDCLTELHAKTNIRVKEVTVGIAGQHISSMQNSASRMRSKPHELITEGEVQELQKDMYKIRLKPGQEILHVTPQDYIIDEHATQKAVGCDGSKLTGNYHIVMGETASIKKIQMCVERCGLRLKKVVLEPFASADAVLTAEEREEGVAMLDIGGGTSDLIIYHQNMVRSTFVIPCGGEVITNDIRELCSINRTMAEYAKQEHGSCFPEDFPNDDGITFQGGIGRDPRPLKYRTLAEVIQARVDEIIEAVDYKIMESGYSHHISSIVLTGGGSMLKNITQLVKLRTGLDARIGQPNVYLAADKQLRTVRPSLSTSVGLVMSGYEQLIKSSLASKGSFNLPFGKKIVEKVITRFDTLFNEENINDDMIIDQIKA
jgi:cell division protein FtsA